MQSLRTWRILRGLNQRELAALANLSPGVVNNAEKGQSLTVRSMHKIANALSVRPEEIAEFYPLIYGTQPPVESAHST